MTAISGVTNGSIDVNSIVSQLMTVESQPLTALQTRLSGVQTKISALGQVRSALSSLDTAAQALDSPDTWSGTTTSSSDPTAVTATTTSGATAGSHDVVVSKLAQAQTMVTSALAGSDSVVGGGTVHVQLGTLDPASGSFTANSANPQVSITIPSGATMAQVRDAINSAGAGVTASLMTDANGARLVVRSNTTGLSNAVQIQVDGGEAGSNLSMLAYDPAPSGTKNMTLAQGAQNALLTIDGISVSSASNTVTGAIDNVTLNLVKSGTGNVNLGIQPDTASMRSVVDKFVSAYNSLTKTIANLTSYNATTKTAATLEGNTTIMMIQRQLRSVEQAVMGSGTLKSLSQAGLQVQSDGTITVNDNVYSAAAANPSQLQTLFAASSTDPTQVGIARRFDTLLFGMLGTDGAMTGATDTLNKQSQDIQNQETDWQDRLTKIQNQLITQYSALNTSLSSYSSTSSFLASKFYSTTNTSG